MYRIFFNSEIHIHRIKSLLNVTRYLILKDDEMTRKTSFFIQQNLFSPKQTCNPEILSMNSCSFHL